MLSDSRGDLNLRRTQKNPGLDCKEKGEESREAGAYLIDWRFHRPDTATRYQVEGNLTSVLYATTSSSSLAAPNARLGLTISPVL